MKDMIERYEEFKSPGSLDVYFGMVLVIDLFLAIWMAFNASLHANGVSFSKWLYIALCPIAFLFPVFAVTTMKKMKRIALAVNNVYLISRLAYLIPAFVIDMIIQLKKTETQSENEKIIYSSLFVIVSVIVFSVFWLVFLNRSRKIRYHLEKE